MIEEPAAVFTPVDYNRSFDLSQIQPHDQVWIVDYSIPPEQMRELLAITQDVVWIDHHKSAIEEYADFEQPIRGYRSSEDAACVLTFKYIHWWTMRGEGPEDFAVGPDATPVPKPIMLVGDRDVWRWEFGDQAKFFCTGISAYNTQPESGIWKELLLGPEQEAFFQKMVFEGEIVERYRDQYYREYREALAFPTQFSGQKCFAMNVGKVGSDVFGPTAMDEYEILMPFSYDGSQWKVSLFSGSVDVSKIAEGFGGGGHRGAAGFNCKELPFDK